MWRSPRAGGHITFSCAFSFSKIGRGFESERLSKLSIDCQQSARLRHASVQIRLGKGDPKYQLS